MNSPEMLGVIGDPIEHSLSPVIHAAAYAAMGLSWNYGRFLVRTGDVPAALGGARALGFRGLSVTMPHKEAAARAADQVSDRVTKLGAANTISFRAGVLVAESTDGEGLLDDLRDGIGFHPDGANCVVIGAGGAARAIVLALFEAGARAIVIINRTLATAEGAAAALAPQVARIGTLADVANAAVVINATPIGMHSSAAVSASDFDVVGAGSHVGTGQLVVDLVYVPERTALLEAASANGAIIRNGLGMLVAQAARQIELWSDLAAPRAVMLAAAEQAMLA